MFTSAGSSLFFSPGPLWISASLLNGPPWLNKILTLHYINCGLQLADFNSFYSLFSKFGGCNWTMTELFSLFRLFQKVFHFLQNVSFLSNFFEFYQFLFCDLQLRNAIERVWEFVCYWKTQWYLPVAMYFKLILKRNVCGVLGRA